MGNFISKLKKFAGLNNNRKRYLSEYKEYFWRKLGILIDVNKHLFDLYYSKIKPIKSDEKIHLVVKKYFPEWTTEMINRNLYLSHLYTSLESEINRSKKGTITICQSLQSLDYIPPDNIDEIISHALIIDILAKKTDRIPNLSLEYKLDLSMFKLMGAAKSLLSHLETKIKSHPKKQYGPMTEKGIRESIPKKELVYKIYTEDKKLLIDKSFNAIAEKIHQIIYDRRISGEISKDESPEPPSPPQIKRYLEACYDILDNFRYVRGKLIRQP